MALIVACLALDTMSRSLALLAVLAAAAWAVDQPCERRDYGESSFVCVCNA